MLSDSRIGNIRISIEVLPSDSARLWFVRHHHPIQAGISTRFGESPPENR